MNDNKTSRTFVHSVLPKILSLLAAFVLWFYVMSVDSPVHEKEFASIPITVTQSSVNLSVYSGSNGTVDIRVRGKKALINSISASDFIATADISDVTVAGKYTIPVAITLPDGVTLTERSVDSIEVYIDNKNQKAIPVEVKLTDYQLENNYEIDETAYKTDINEITVTGPATLISTIEKARVQISCGNQSLSSSFKVRQEFILLDAAGEPVNSPYITADSTDVEVTVPVYLTKSMPVSVDFKNGFLNDNNVKIAITPGYLRVRAEAGTLEAMDTLPIATLNEKMLTSGKMTVQITLPDGIENLSDKETVFLDVTHINTGTTTLTIPKSNISVVNPNNLNYTINDDSLVVTMRAPSDLLSALTDKDIGVFIDLTNMKIGAGTISLAAQIKVSDAYASSVYEIGEYKVSVTVN